MGAKARVCRRRSFAAANALVMLATLTAVPSAHAQLDLARVAKAAAGGALPRMLGRRVSTIVELAPGQERPQHFVPIGASATGSELGVLELATDRLAALAAERPTMRLQWSPPLRLLMDRVDGWVHAQRFRNATGATGRGVLIGIVDTGVDPTHPDFRDAADRTRIRYWLDFSKERADLHPELEDAFACRSDPNDAAQGPCAVLSGRDLDDWLDNSDPNDDPHDPLGHGTHVASLAAGNGRSSTPARYVGIAPEAELVVSRVLRTDGAIYDADVLKAVRFIFDRADELGMPAVVNLSLGNDFGGHDGTSALERGLESMIGPEHPGRAVVVAAGNSAALYDARDTGVPGPLGVHTEVHVPDAEPVIVPLITPLTSANGTSGTVYVWIATRPGDELAVGVDTASGPLLEPVPPGSQQVKQHGGAEIVVVNGAEADASPVPAGAHGAVVVIEGSWGANETFGLRLEGPASAEVWVMGDGALSPGRSLGPLVPRATRAGTINVPASSPALIAVGATLNRTTWTDLTGEAVTFPALGALDPAPEDTVAFFSSAGPNARGSLKPDILAPGANVIGALARTADPRFDGASEMFADTGECAERGYSPLCLVADDQHAVSSGTSMAAPIVAGAIALLFQRDPTLDQTRVRALLQAGARRPAGVIASEQQVGAGALDLDRTLEALTAGDTERLPGARTEILLAAEFAHPDLAWPLEGLVELRDDQGHIADGFAESRLRLELAGASGAEVVEPPLRLAPGLYRFRVAAAPGSGGRTLELGVLFDGRVLAKTSVPIAVDPQLARELPSARGGCAFISAPYDADAWWLVLGLGAAVVGRNAAARARRRRSGNLPGACGNLRRP